MRLTFGSPDKPTDNPRGFDLACEVPVFSCHESLEVESEKNQRNLQNEMMATPTKHFYNGRGSGLDVHDHLNAEYMDNEGLKKDFYDTLRHISPERKTKSSNKKSPAERRILNERAAQKQLFKDDEEALKTSNE